MNVFIKLYDTVTIKLDTTAKNTDINGVSCV